MKKLPHDYEHLAPTIMDVELVYEYLEELISLARTGDYDRFEVCKGLCELIQIRLGDILRPLDEQRATAVFDLLASYWPDEEQHLDVYLTVLVNLGMDDRLRELLDNKSSGVLQDYEVRLINEIYEELQGQQGGPAPTRSP